MPFSDPERRRAYHRDRHRRRRAAGLCAQCNETAVAGLTRCANHLSQVDVVQARLKSVTRTLRALRANLDAR